MMNLVPRIFIVNKNGKLHQSWNLVDHELVLTMDVNPSDEFPLLYGLYQFEEYVKRIKQNEFIQENLPEKHPDKINK